jgi:DNA helicase II / ATP-dependent DNA helicase PcrA
MAKKRTTTKRLSTENLVIKAGAGCGKSTTLEWTEDRKRMPKSVTPSPQQEAIFKELGKSKHKPKDVRVACFNVSIMDDLIPKFHEDTDVRNTNKIGYHALLKGLGKKGSRFHVQTGKYKKLLREQLNINPYNNNALWDQYTATINLVDLTRQTMTGNLILSPSGNRWEVAPSELFEMADFYNMDINTAFDDAVPLVEPLINLGITTESLNKSVDFIDQVFGCVVHGYKPPKKFRTYIDEAQDCNAMQHALMMDTSEQFVVVGDEYQSMYGFAGSDPESMARLQQMLKAGTLPLTVTRRCPQSHVERAKRNLPKEFAEVFQAAPEAPEGLITPSNFGVEFYRSLEGKDNLILSRTNAPMVRACFKCWKNGIPALIRGRSIASNMAGTIDKFSDKGRLSNAEVVGVLMDHYQNKIDIYKQNDKEDLALAAQDEQEIIITFLEESKTIEECKKNMFAMFDDKKALENAIQFSTVHKAKGLEAQHVGILTPELLPHPGISKLGPFWLRQELNIAYVCDTRSKENIYLNENTNE